MVGKKGHVTIFRQGKFVGKHQSFKKMEGEFDMNKVYTAIYDVKTALNNVICAINNVICAINKSNNDTKSFIGNLEWGKIDIKLICVSLLNSKNMHNKKSK